MLPGAMLLVPFTIVAAFEKSPGTFVTPAPIAGSFAGAPPVAAELPATLAAPAATCAAALAAAALPIAAAFAEPLALEPELLSEVSWLLMSINC